MISGSEVTGLEIWNVVLEDMEQWLLMLIEVDKKI